MLRQPRVIITFLFFVCVVCGQNFRSVDDIKDDWQDHTTFQKHELLSFCDFLIDGGHYERALLSLFNIYINFRVTVWKRQCFIILPGVMICLGTPS